MTFRGQNIQLTDITLKDETASFGVVFTSDTGTVHATTRHALPVASIPGAREAIEALRDALLAHVHPIHFERSAVDSIPSPQKATHGGLGEFFAATSAPDDAQG